MDGASDEDLMLRIATGDEPAFRVLARRYAPLALRLARRVMGSSAPTAITDPTTVTAASA